MFAAALFFLLQSDPDIIPATKKCPPLHRTGEPDRGAVTSDYILTHAAGDLTECVQAEYDRRRAEKRRKKANQSSR